MVLFGPCVIPSKRGRSDGSTRGRKGEYICRRVHMKDGGNRVFFCAFLHPCLSGLLHAQALHCQWLTKLISIDSPSEHNAHQLGPPEKFSQHCQYLLSCYPTHGTQRLSDLPKVSGQVTEPESPVLLTQLTDKTNCLLMGIFLTVFGQCLGNDEMMLSFSPHAVRASERDFVPLGSPGSVSQSQCFQSGEPGLAQGVSAARGCFQPLMMMCVYQRFSSFSVPCTVNLVGRIFILSSFIITNVLSDNMKLSWQGQYPLFKGMRKDIKHFRNVFI